jgi:flagellar hook-associated protein 1 FlgK
MFAMSLNASIAIASQSLANINLGFAIISQNVANASTPGYQAEQQTDITLDAGGLGMGVASGPTQVASSPALQAQLYQQNAAASGAGTTSSALQNLQSVLGTVGQGTDLGSLLTNLQSSFSTLLNDPGSQTQQLAVVNAAQNVAQQVNAMSNAYGQARQAAQDGLVSNVGALNTALARVGALNAQIVALTAQGASSADLQNQRSQALTTISGLVSANFVEQSDGAMDVFTTGGAQLPTDGSATLSIAPASAGAGPYYPGGGLPGILLGGTDITGNLKGGAIGANLTLRDQTLPTYQGEIDEFAENLATRFSAQGLTLFSDSSGNVPAGGGTPAQTGYVGFASVMTVNPTVVAAPADVRDGTQDVAGSATGASAYTINPDGLAGFTGMIDRVLNYSLGADVQDGVTQPAPTVTGLGASGTLDAPFAAPATLGDFANVVTTSQSTDSASATTASTDATGVQTSLSSTLNGQTGVDVDSQLSRMVQLQNAYGANGKIISTIEEMFQTLLNDITPLSG